MKATSHREAVDPPLRGGLVVFIVPMCNIFWTANIFWGLTPRKLAKYSRQVKVVGYMYIRVLNSRMRSSVKTNGGEFRTGQYTGKFLMVVGVYLLKYIIICHGIFKRLQYSICVALCGTQNPLFSSEYAHEVSYFRP